MLDQRTPSGPFLPDWFCDSLNTSREGFKHALKAVGGIKHSPVQRVASYPTPKWQKALFTRTRGRSRQRGLLTNVRSPRWLWLRSISSPSLPHLTKGWLNSSSTFFRCSPAPHRPPPTADPDPSPPDLPGGWLAGGLPWAGACARPCPHPAPLPCWQRSPS